VEAAGLFKMFTEIQACRLKSMKPLYCILTMLLVLILAGRSNAQKGHGVFFKTPDRVIAVLDSLYPGTKNVQWSRRRKRYTADFIHDTRNFSISLNSHGTVLTSLEEINYNFLPDRIREKLKESYNTYKIVMVLQRSANAKVDYDIEIIQGRLHHLLNYNSKGNLIRHYDIVKVDRFAGSSDDE
jgi:hypothetical protein